MSRAKRVGLSRRELEWVVQGMLRQTPSDPASLAKQLAELVVALIEKNNAAIAKTLSHGEDGPDEDDGRF